MKGSPKPPVSLYMGPGELPRLRDIASALPLIAFLLYLMVPGGIASAQDPSLKLHLDFDHATPPGIVLDQSGNAAHGVQFNTTNLLSSADGVFDSQAAWFRYVGYMTNDPPNVYPLSQYLAVTNVAAFRYLTNGTISFWAQFGPNNDVGMHVLDTGYNPQYTPNPGLASNSWTIGRSIDPYLSFTVYGSAGAQTVATWPTDVVNPGGPNRDLSTTAFHLYSVTFDCSAGIATSYYDGEPYQTRSISVPWLRIYGGSAKRWLCIGAMAHTGTPEWGDDRYPNSGFFVGRMDEVRIYDRVLSPGEVGSLYYGADNVVAVSATDPAAGEPGTGKGNGTFTFTRTGPATTSLIASFAVTGTATTGIDYNDLGTTVAFEPGVTAVMKTVNVLDDLDFEGNETVTVSLTAGAGYPLGTPASATLTMEDDEGATPEIILDDNNSTAVAYSGTWTASSGTPGYWSTGYRHDGNSSKGNKTATFRPNLPSAGAYQVYTWYPAKSNYASNVPIQIVHAGGTNSLTVNQKVNGNMWNFLGAYNFNAGTVGYVRIRTSGTSEYVIADAVKFVSGGTVLPDITVTTSDATAGEPGTGFGGGVFQFTRSGSTASALTIDFLTGGTATSGSDYAALGSSVTFAAGSATATRVVNVNDDTEIESDETVTVTVASGAGYNLGSPGSATVAIKDDEVAPVEVLVDNAAASGVQYVGTWSQSTGTPGYWASNYRHDGNSSKGTRSVTFTPNLPSAGVYEVYIWYPARSDYASNVPVDVLHADGITTVLLNQKTAGSRWNLLGTFNFSEGTAGNVRIRTTSTSGYVIADAVKFVPGGTVLPQVTVTARDATAGEPGTGLAGAEFEFTRSGPADVPLTVGLSIGGSATGGTDYIELATSVTFEAGSTTATRSLVVYDDSQPEGDETVGLTVVNGPGYVVGSANTATVTIKDDDTAAAEVIVDNPSAGFTPTWSLSTSTPGYWSLNYQHDGNAGKGTKTATFTPNLTEGGSYQVYMWYPARSDYAGAVPVDVGHSGGTTTVYINQKVNGSRWNLLGTFNFSLGTSGYARIRTTGTTGYVMADAIKWVPVAAPNGAPEPTRVLARVGNLLPILTITRDSAGDLLLQWPTRAGVFYSLQSSLDGGATWQAVAETYGDGSHQSWLVSPDYSSALFRLDASSTEESAVPDTSR